MRVFYLRYLERSFVLLLNGDIYLPPFNLFIYLPSNLILHMTYPRRKNDEKGRLTHISKVAGGSRREGLRVSALP